MQLIARASRMPLAMRCPGSLQRPDLAVDEISEPAEQGTAAHELLPGLASTGHLDWDAIPEVAARYGTDPDELHMLCASGAKLWARVRESFPNPLTEVALSVELIPGFILTGHADLISISGTVAAIGDWKSGRKDTDYSEQLKAYAALELAENPELTKATSTILWLRECAIENYTMPRDALEDYRQRVKRTVLYWDGTLHAGAHCQYCPRAHECQAGAALARVAVSAFTDAQLVDRAQTEIALMEPGQILRLHEQCKLAAFYADKVHTALKQHVLDVGDIVSDGQRLTVETTHPRALDPLRAWPVLEAAGFQDADFASCVKLSVTAMEKQLRSKQPRGKGASAVRELGKALEKADAIRTTERHALTVRRS
jgi:hypothetical protein